MKKATRSLFILTIGLVLGIALTVGGSVLADRTDVQNAPLPLDELQNFAEVFGKIKSDYVEPVKDKALLESAIRGMLAGLDPHSAYLDPKEFKDLQVSTTGEFGGLGIEVGMEDGFVKVISPIDDTPAQKAGIKPGDLIVRLNETLVKGLTLNDAVNMMRGKPGTKITLTVVREGEPKPLKFAITREVIKVKSVKYHTLESHYGYVRITSFQTQTGEQLMKALSALKKENGGKLDGLVLDLRNNPGGVLGAAVSVADAFLTKGLIVYTDGRTKDSQSKYMATPGDMLNGAPIVVLVNGGTASAAEIVSGALQDHKRALIMGSRTFGKGSVQTIFPMSNGGAVKLTTARYFTPSGRSIQAEGIVPDIKLRSVKLASVPNADQDMLKEADLTGHLLNDEAKKDNANAKKEKVDPSVNKDYGVHEALNLLRGLHILRARAAE